MAVDRSKSARLAPLVHPDAAAHAEQIAIVVNRTLAGKVNCTGTVTLTANVASTAVTDQLAGPNSTIYLSATTANAAAEIGAGGLYISAKTDGSFTITHANNAQSDRTFDYAVFGP